MGDMVNMAMDKFGGAADQAGGAIDSAMGGDFSKGYDSYNDGATPETLMKLGDPSGGADPLKADSIKSLMGMIPSANPKAGRGRGNRPGMKGNDYIRSLMGG